jgi:NADH-quinone oxidoreductase subunit A
MLFIIISRGVLPRYKYQQLMNLCWKILFPAAIFYFYLLVIFLFIFKMEGNFWVISNFSQFIDFFAQNNCLEGVNAKKGFFFFLNFYSLCYKTSAFEKVFIFFLASFFFAFLLTCITWVLIPKKRSNAKTSSYECGYEPVGSPTANFEVHFYVVAILFIIFDVEILFLYPWALGAIFLPLKSFFVLSLFLATLLIGYFYEWGKGALDWENEIIKKKNDEF